MKDGYVKATLPIANSWAKDQWVMVYIFSDETANKYGFGAFVPRVGVKYF